MLDDFLLVRLTVFLSERISSIGMIHDYVTFLTLGIGGGTFSLVVPIYVSESAETSIRGTLGSSLQLMINCGVTVA